jgi:hypothetical protein
MACGFTDDVGAIRASFIDDYLYGPRLAKSLQVLRTAMVGGHEQRMINYNCPDGTATRIIARVELDTNGPLATEEWA